MPYKPVECQSLEKDIEIQIILSPCRNWNKKENCCNGFYDAFVNKKYENFIINKNDIDKNCIKNNGNSNVTLCCYFKADFFTSVL